MVSDRGPRNSSWQRVRCTPVVIRSFEHRTEGFRRFKNGDFEVEDQHGGGREKVFEDAELEALLDQDSCQTQQELSGSLGVTQQAISKRLKVMGMIQKQGNWVPYELKPRDVERRLFVCQ
ncbi:mariner Mos1 transposase [Trichonephila clavipes]|nr:mariner Mos1 transposase [Trichonephila clavipes]